MPRSKENKAGQSDAGEPGTILTEQVKQGTQNAVHQAQQTAGSLAGQAKEQTTSLLESRKGNATQSLSAVSQALRQTGQSLENSEQAPVEEFVSRAADHIDRLRGYLESRNVEELVADTEAFARRSPTVFLGGAFVLGLVAARFLKSSAPTNNNQAPYGGRSGPARYGGNGSQGGYSGTSVQVDDGPYDYRDVPHPTEHVEGVPAVDIEYAPGLMGTGSERRSGDGA